MRITHTNAQNPTPRALWLGNNAAPPHPFARQGIVSDVVQTQINSLNKATWASANADARNLLNDLYRMRSQMDDFDVSAEENIEELEGVVESLEELIASGAIDPEDEYIAKRIREKISDLLESAEFALLRERVVAAAQRIGISADDMDNAVEDALTAIATRMVKTGRNAANVVKDFAIEGLGDDLFEEIRDIFNQIEEIDEKFFGLSAPEHVLEFLQAVQIVAQENEDGNRINVLLDKIDNIKNRLP